MGHTSPIPSSSSSPILVVDDEQDIVLTLRDLLEADGHNINVASTGGTALECIKLHSPSVVILDVKLPDMDGLLVLEKMTKAVPGLPIIILSSYTTLDDVTGPLEEQGAFAYLHKPINRSEIRTTVRQALKAYALAKKMERARHALYESEIRFQAVFQAATDAIVLADHTGRIMSWNKAAESMFEYTAEEMFGKPLTLIMPSRYREAHTKGMNRLQTTGESHVIGKTITLHGLRKSGQEFPIELSLNSWMTGTHPSYSGFIRDLSFRESKKERPLEFQNV
ncbi:response regulator [Candidatus Nitrospira neomarina]|uniref:Response regulator n=1 Tax=Candidatus Nitrospira neomarina TaxID=3020899 RepID=A0AA96K217_9BACT|nr:response regulator [Candidatus Nitrospira neomarina]WNM61244.1 response regulator [Candidatus Nitrospira neomarina]